MKQSKKIAILGVGIQIFLAVPWTVLLATAGSQSPETAQRIGQVGGGAMGVLGVLCLGWWYLERKAGR